MKLSEMTPVQRKLLLEEQENYPLRVSFLGKDAILTREQLDFLREQLIDVDVDDGLAEAVLGKRAVARALDRRRANRVREELREVVQQAAETALPPERQTQLRRVEGEALGGIAGLFAALLRLLQRILRL